MYVTITKYPYLMLDCERRAEMGRLTERFDNGQAAVKGCGENCKYDYKYCRNHYEECPEINKIYERLAEYEDTGLTPPEIMELKERDTEKKILPLTYKPLLEAGWRYECPNCGCAVGENIYHPDVTKDYEYCSMCGQKLEG